MFLFVRCSFCNRMNRICTNRWKKICADRLNETESKARDRVREREIWEKQLKQTAGFIAICAAVVCDVYMRGKKRSPLFYLNDIADWLWKYIGIIPLIYAILHRLCLVLRGRTTTTANNLFGWWSRNRSNSIHSLGIQFMFVFRLKSIFIRPNIHFHIFHELNEAKIAAMETVEAVPTAQSHAKFNNKNQVWKKIINTQANNCLIEHTIDIAIGIQTMPNGLNACANLLIGCFCTLSMRCFRCENCSWTKTTYTHKQEKALQ